MYYDRITASADYIRANTHHSPEIAIILGSGLGALVERMEDPQVLPYAQIPHFPQSRVAGHAGNLVLGRLGGRTVAVMQGRFHYYEGFTMQELVYPVYVFRQLGIKSLVVTNACGGIARDLAPGSLMLMEDYINLLGLNPLIGPNDDRLGPRFPDMTEPYSHALLEKAEQAARALDIPIRRGVYGLFNGPCFETAAEIRAYAALGADVVGMSTVPETIAAVHAGMRVLGICCITNMATGIAREKHSHEEVLRIAGESSHKLQQLVLRVLETWE